MSSRRCVICLQPSVVSGSFLKELLFFFFYNCNVLYIFHLLNSEIIVKSRPKNTDNVFIHLHLKVEEFTFVLKLQHNLWTDMELAMLYIHKTKTNFNSRPVGTFL